MSYKKCNLRRLRHLITLPSSKIWIEAVYCSSGLHETNVSLAEKSSDSSTSPYFNSDKIASWLVSWLNSYAINPVSSATANKMPPFCKYAFKNGKGESEFEKSIWAALDKHVPAGKIVSYAKLAELAKGANTGEGRRFARAVGQVMRHNPIGLLRACHRVVPSSSAGKGDDTKSNYGSYGGVACSTTKRALLDFELSFENENVQKLKNS